MEQNTRRDCRGCTTSSNIGRATDGLLRLVQGRRSADSVIIALIALSSHCTVLYTLLIRCPHCCDMFAPRPRMTPWWKMLTTLECFSSYNHHDQGTRKVAHFLRCGHALLAGGHSDILPRSPSPWCFPHSERGSRHLCSRPAQQPGKQFGHTGLKLAHILCSFSTLSY